VVAWLRLERERRARIHRVCRAQLRSLPAAQRLEVAAAALAELTYGYTVGEALARCKRLARKHGRRRK
jgi:hypothetical protein